MALRVDDPWCGEAGSEILGSMADRDDWSDIPHTSPRILNEIPVPERKRQRALDHEIPVRARIQWEDGAEEVHETVAFAEAPGMTLVLWHDPRRPRIGVWLANDDVERL